MKLKLGLDRTDTCLKLYFLMVDTNSPLLVDTHFEEKYKLDLQSLSQEPIPINPFPSKEFHKKISIVYKFHLISKIISLKARIFLLVDLRTLLLKYSGK